MSDKYKNQNDFSNKHLGGANKGYQALLFGNAMAGNDRSLSRKCLTKAFGNLYNSGLKSSPSLYKNNILGPFRTSINGGDVVTTDIDSTNLKYGYEPNLTGGNNLSKVSVNGGGMRRNGNAMYSGNPRFIYDGSDYIRFKKLQAVNKNFNDKSFGGANHNNTQSVIKHVRS